MAFQGSTRQYKMNRVNNVSPKRLKVSSSEHILGQICFFFQIHLSRISNEVESSSEHLTYSTIHHLDDVDLDPIFQKYVKAKREEEKKLRWVFC